MTAPAFAQDAAHERVPVRMVRQDCGSWDGMRLSGVPGPVLTRDALAGKAPEFLAATIYHGLPGNPMASWKAC